MSSWELSDIEAGGSVADSVFSNGGLKSKLAMKVSHSSSSASVFCAVIEKLSCVAYDVVSAANIPYKKQMLLSVSVLNITQISFELAA